MHNPYSPVHSLRILTLFKPSHSFPPVTKIFYNSVHFPSAIYFHPFIPTLYVYILPQSYAAQIIHLFIPTLSLHLHFIPHNVIPFHSFPRHTVTFPPPFIPTSYTSLLHLFSLSYSHLPSYIHFHFILSLPLLYSLSPYTVTSSSPLIFT